VRDKFIIRRLTKCTGGGFFQTQYFDYRHRISELYEGSGLNFFVVEKNEDNIYFSR
jgi:hypothetical protein